MDVLPFRKDLQNLRSVFFKMWPITTVLESDALGRLVKNSDFWTLLQTSSLDEGWKSALSKSKFKTYAHSSSRTTSLQALHKLFLLSRETILAQRKPRRYSTSQSPVFCEAPRCHQNIGAPTFLSKFTFVTFVTHSFIHLSINIYWTTTLPGCIWPICLPCPPSFSRVNGQGNNARCP